MSSVDSIVRGFFEALFPPTCAACLRVGREPFCRLCEEALLPAEPLELEGAAVSRACFAYGGPAALAIGRLKYGGREDLARSLGKPMQEALRSLGAFDSIMPVPLSIPRLRARGYNQALALARALGVPVDARTLVRRIDTRPQVGLPRAERERNMSGAFAVRAAARVRGQRVLLVDDVVTTGATASASTRALLDSGVASVSVLAFACADPGQHGA